MTRILLPCLAASVAATGAFAAGVERSVTPIGVMFEPGTYAELSFSTAQPRTSGRESNAGLVQGFLLDGAPSGDMTAGFSTVGLAYKQQLTPAVALGLFYDQPYGADTAYPAGTGYYAAGSRAELESHSVTAVLKYSFPSNVSVYGGLRYQTLSATADLPYIQGGYTVDGERDEAAGYLVGVAYERPEIAFRVSLTYASEIEHTLATTEIAPIFAAPMVGISPTGVVADETDLVTPQSVTLNFQTGIAADTLLFGAARWAEWTEFAIAPPGYEALAGEPLVEYEDDRWTYSLGIGRRLNETWSVAATLGYEPETGSGGGNLGPTDGFKSVGLGATYTQGDVEVTGGVNYIWLGDAETPQGSEFEDNEAVAAGLKVGYRF